MNSRALAVAALFLLAGCGGGGGGAAPTTTPVVPGHPSLQQATLKITFPVNPGTASSARSPQYVSPNSNSIKITVNSIDSGNTTIPSWVTPNPYTATLATTGGSPNCTVSGGTETCTVINVPAPPGVTNYTFGVYASTDGSGTALATATVNETVVQGILNTFSVTLDGVATTLATNVTTTALTANSPLTQNDIVQVKDPSGARIVGTAPFDGGATVTVTNNDTSGQTSLVAGTGGGSATSCTGNTCTLSHGADTVNFVYTGRAVSGTGSPPVDSFTITVTSSAAPTQTANVSITDLPITYDVTTLDDTAHGGLAGDPNYNQPTLFFAATGNSAGFNAAELGWSNAPYSQSFSTAFEAASCGSGASAVATITPSTGTSFTVTSQNPGICKLTVSDGVGQSKILWISVTTSNFSVNGRKRGV
jgi:hypothetical protein